MRELFRFLALSTLSLGLATLCAVTAHAQEAATSQAQQAPDDEAAEVDPTPQGDDARTLFQRGQAAYAQGDYDAAIDAWTQAYGLDARPLLQFNLSQALERLGRLEDAVAALGLYLDRADPQDVHQADARARQASLRERIGRTSVTVAGAPEGATILVDGEDRGRTPRPDPIVVTPGSHTIIIRLAGFSDFTSSVVVPAGQSAAVDVTMQASAGRAAPGARGGSGPDLLVPGILWGAGGAIIVVGAIIGGVALGEAQSAPGRESPQADSARGLALGADITLGLGAACLAAGIIVLIVELTSGGDDSADVASSSFTVTPSGSTDSAGVVAVGRF